MSLFSPRPTDPPKLNIIDKILAETAFRVEITSYEYTNGVELNRNAESDICCSVIRRWEDQRWNELTQLTDISNQSHFAHISIFS